MPCARGCHTAKTRDLLKQDVQGAAGSNAPNWEAVATYAATACEKLRRQSSVCKQIRVGIRTRMHNPDEPKFARGVAVVLPYPTDDPRMITQYALLALEQVYCKWYAFANAEVLLLDQCQRTEFTSDLFAP